MVDTRIGPHGTMIPYSRAQKGMDEALDKFNAELKVMEKAMSQEVKGTVIGNLDEAMAMMDKTPGKIIEMTKKGMKAMSQEMEAPQPELGTLVGKASRLVDEMEDMERVVDQLAMKVDDLVPMKGASQIEPGLDEDCSTNLVSGKIDMATHRVIIMRNKLDVLIERL